MKILYFIDHLRPEGTQNVLRQLITGLAQRNHDQTIVCLNDSWDNLLVKHFHGIGVNVRSPGKIGLISGYGLLTTWYWMQQERFDAVVTFLFISDVVGKVLARTAGLPRIVSSLRARNIHYNSLQRRLVRFTMHWVDAVVINSKTFRDFAITEEGAPPDRMYVIPNGVEVTNYQNPVNRADLRAMFGLPPEVTLIGSVGRLTHQKGFDLLLQALTLVSNDNTHLVIVGNGEEESQLKSQAARLGLEQHVHFAGYRRDVPQLLGALDLYVHPARFEGMPNALLEAMAAGCPIVASSVDGNCELITDGIHGWLVIPENVNALACAMRTALNNPTEAQQRGRCAQEHVARKYSVEAMVTAWERVLVNL